MFGNKSAGLQEVVSEAIRFRPGKKRLLGTPGLARGVGPDPRVLTESYFALMRPFRGLQ